MEPVTGAAAAGGAKAGLWTWLADNAVSLIVAMCAGASTMAGWMHRRYRVVHERIDAVEKRLDDGAQTLATKADMLMMLEPLHKDVRELREYVLRIAMRAGAHDEA